LLVFCIFIGGWVGCTFFFYEENHHLVGFSKEPPVDTRLELPEEQVSTEDKAEDFTPEEQPVANLRAATEGIYVTTINELEIGITHDEEPNAEFSDTNKEFVDAVEDNFCRAC
jgi:hypothetical protein